MGGDVKPLVLPCTASHVKLVGTSKNPKDIGCIVRGAVVWPISMLRS